MKRTPNLIHSGAPTSRAMWDRWQRFARRQVTSAIKNAVHAPLYDQRSKANARLQALKWIGVDLVTTRPGKKRAEDERSY